MDKAQIMLEGLRRAANMQAMRTRISRDLWMLAALALSAAAVSAQGRLTQVEQEERSFQVNATPTVRIGTFDGTIRIEAWERSEVRYTAEKRGRNQSDLERIEIEAVQNGDYIQVEARLRSRTSWSSYAAAHITVFVPRRANLNARTGDGRIEARDVSGEISLTTGDGHVSATNLSGNLAIRTGDGSITLMDVSGRLRAQTGDGRMQVRGRFEELEAATGDGTMEITVERGSKMATSWRLSTGDGTIQLALPDDFSAELDIRTNDGSISTELPVMISGRIGNTLQGRLNQGGYALTVRTGDGSIVLRRS
jgi:hypothetical protein